MNKLRVILIAEILYKSSWNKQLGLDGVPELGGLLSNTRVTRLRVKNDLEILSLIDFQWDLGAYVANSFLKVDLGS